MSYYIYLENRKLNGAGQARQLTDGVDNIEVSEELFNTYIETPEKYIYSDGEIVENPNYEAEQAQKERDRLNMLSLTKREVFLALYKNKGLTPEQLRSQITDPEALIEFDFANDYYRGNPLINQIGMMLGYSSDDLDYLFVNKSLPVVDNPEPPAEENSDTEPVTDDVIVNNEDEESK